MVRFLLLGAVFAILPSLTPSPSALAQAPLVLGDAEGRIHILADQIEQVGEDGVVIATGNVEITRGDQRLLADRVELNRKTGEATAVGRVVLFDGKDRLVGERLDYNFQTGTGVVHNASAFSEPYYRISGESMERIGERIYRVRRGVFTTCEADPPDWAFHAEVATAELDEFIVGRDASFWVRRIPLIPWIPFFAAPIRSDRQTGFLFPTAGTSSTKGAFAKIPFYWAISDSQDLTLSLDVYSKRGVGFGGDYRYILSESSRGTAGGFFIDEFLKDGEDRGTFFLKHDWAISPRFSFKADVNWVSDDQFLRDYGDQLRVRSSQFVESNVFLTQRWELWSFVANAFWYQDLTTGQPDELQRLPELRLQGVPQPLPGIPWLMYETETSFVNFVRDLGSNGPRADFHPRVLLPLSAGGLFTFTPFVGGRATYYDKRVVGTMVVDGIQVEDTVTLPRIRALVEWGADVQARASRVFDVGGLAGIAAVQHLIEPWMNYTGITGANQNGIPQWDPGGGLVNPVGVPFETNLGVDKIGNINVFTYALTNRLNAKTVAGEGQEPVRWEMARFVLSQTYDLRVGGSAGFGDLRGEVVLRPNRIFNFRADASYNVHGLQTLNTDFGLAVRNLAAGVGTRFSQGAIGFVQGELRARLLPELDIRSSINFDTRQGTLVEGRFGVDYRFQCWSVALEYIGRHQSEDEFRFSINLLGLGTLGRKPAVSGAGIPE